MIHPEMDELDQAFCHGYATGWDGYSCAYGPYKQGTPEELEYMRGFRLAQKEMKNKPPRYTIKDLHECVVRELGLRKKVYPGLIQNQSMSPDFADAEITKMDILRKLLLTMIRDEKQPELFQAPQDEPEEIEIEL